MPNVTIVMSFVGFIIPSGLEFGLCGILKTPKGEPNTRKNQNNGNEEFDATYHKDLQSVI